MALALRTSGLGLGLVLLGLDLGLGLDTVGLVNITARLPIDSVPMVSYNYYVLYSNCVCKMRRFGDTRLLKLP